MAKMCDTAFNQEISTVPARFLLLIAAVVLLELLTGKDLENLLQSLLQPPFGPVLLSV